MKIIKGIISIAIIGVLVLGFRKWTQEMNSYKSRDTSTFETCFEESFIGGGFNSFAGDSGIGVGDMDGDGDLDIIVADRFAALHYLENVNGVIKDRGAISSGTNSFSGDVDLVLVDLDKDGDLDIVYTDRGARVYFVRNNITQQKRGK